MKNSSDRHSRSKTCITASYEFTSSYGATLSPVIKSFPPGSFGGSDGHIEDLIYDETNSLLVEVITDFDNLLLSGISDQLINNIFYGDRHIALQKKSGSIRPIAIGYTLKRLAAKCANKKATVENIPETREFTFTPLSDLILLGAPVTTGANLDKILKAKTYDLAKAI